MNMSLDSLLDNLPKLPSGPIQSVLADSLSRRDIFTLVAMHAVLVADPVELDKVEEFALAAVAFADATIAELDKPKE